jgi:hypothetical protein
MGNQTKFINQAANWSIVSSGIHDKHFLCGDEDIIGVYNETLKTKSISRTYTSVPKHDMIIYRVVIYLIDDWTGQSLSISFGSKTVTLWPYERDVFTENICGSAATLKFVLYGQVFRGETLPTTLPITITTNFDTQTGLAGWGIREIGLIFTNKTDTDIELECADSPISFPVMCECRDGQFKDANGLCQTCHFACASCTGPTVMECFSCKDGYPLVDGKCGYDTCPVGMTIPEGLNMNDRKCTNCIENCDKCDLDIKGCEWCSPGFFYFNETSSCITECPIGYWASSTDRMCKPCAKFCKACSATQCYFCEGNRVYPYGKLCFTYEESKENFIMIYSLVLVIILGYVGHNLNNL